MPSLGLKGYLAKLGPDPGASAGTQKKLEKPDGWSDVFFMFFPDQIFLILEYIP